MLKSIFCNLIGDDDSSDDEELDEVEFSGEPPEPPDFTLLEAEDPDLQVALIRGFMTPAEVAMVHQAADDPTVKEINDREETLVYKHHVWRFEHQLKGAAKGLYDRLMRTAWALDGDLWESIEDGETLYPEIEYIVYDVKKLGEPGTIQPHRDNQSAVTVVVLLAQPEAFEGGVNFFEPGADGEEDRSARLTLGDAVFFYGDKCSHWITPVVSGRRTILQMELSRGLPACRPFIDEVGKWLRC